MARKRWPALAFSPHMMSLSALALAVIVLIYSAQLIGNVAADDLPVALESTPDDRSGPEPEVVANVDDASSGNNAENKPRITLLGLENILNLERSGIVGLGSDFVRDDGDVPPRLDYNQLHADDLVEDSFYDPFSPDPSCMEGTGKDGESSDEGGDCWHPPVSTIEEEMIVEEAGNCDDSGNPAGLETLAWGYGGADPDDAIQEEQEEYQEEGQDEDSADGSDDKKEGGSEHTASSPQSDATPGTLQCAAPKTKFVDKHWGSNIDILKMRDRLRGRRGKYWDMSEQEEEGSAGNYATEAEEDEPKKSHTEETQQQERGKRPPVFLLPGLASTRLVSWKHKPCPQSPLLSDIKMLDYVWLNMNILIQMATIDARCFSECLTLGKYQSDYDEEGSEKEEGHAHGCKLRPDEGLDAISSLAPGSISSNLFVGGTNTVYAWLIQWLADNLGYDVTSIVALPYDWRLSPDKTEARDGFLTLTRKKIEAAVESNGMPGIMVAHSMGNSVFRYFLEWLRVQMREEAYERYVQQASVAAATAATQAATNRGPFWRRRALYRRLVHGPVDLEDSPSGDAQDEHVLHEAEHATGPDDDDSASSEGQEEFDADGKTSRKYPQLYELAKIEGDAEWIDWLGKHIWTYIGLSAPLLGASGPLRSVLSGENMGLPFTHEEARGLELSFGSTSTANPISTKSGFCDGELESATSSKRRRAKGRKQSNSNLACLEELVSGIESSKGADPWKEFPALRLLLKDRVDFDSVFPIVRVECDESDENEDSPCKNQTSVEFGPKQVMDGQIFGQFSKIWNEKGDPLGVKLDQLRASWWDGNVPNMLETTPDRPHIKHVIMAYGTDVATEIGYVYRKQDIAAGSSGGNSTKTKKKKSADFDGVPLMKEVIWEERNGRLVSESQLTEKATFTETLLRKKKDKTRPLKTDGGETATWLHHSGDGTIPYISLMWAHTWLLHATRAMRSLNSTVTMLEGERISNPNNALDSIRVSHRPRGGNEWLAGYGAVGSATDDAGSNDGDTGTSHPHGTKYKPKMVRFQSFGKSRSTGMEYTTTVIEAIGVEHKETTRNYDILAAAFTDVLQNLHDDYNMV